MLFTCSFVQKLMTKPAASCNDKIIAEEVNFTQVLRGGITFSRKLQTLALQQQCYQ